MKWVSTTENEKWSEKNKFSDKEGKKLVVGEKIGKPLYGWGCCISEICAKAVFGLSEEKQKAIFDELFGIDGCNFNYCRLPIGANDFAESWYSYNENDGDYEMQNFSIERDKKYIIPAVKEAQKRSPEIMFFASPWSPPTWMKFPKVCNYGQIVETDANLKAYAKYLKKYLEEYKKNGIDIKQIFFQNEFISDQKFPSCVWKPEAIEKFLADYLIDEIGEMADIWFGTYNGPETDWRQLTTRYYQYVGTIMQNEKCRNSIKGMGFQWAGRTAIIQAKEDFPNMDFINSEMECGDGKNTWEHAIYTYELMHHYFKFGAKANVYWNMALENEGLSSWGWYQNSLISVKNGEYVFNPEFYLYKHFSHFVKRGAVMLKTSGEFSSNTTVFENPDGSRIAIVMNPFSEEKILTIECNNYVLKPRSFNTIIL
mgnify:CR=1 FL=1